MISLKNWQTLLPSQLMGLQLKGESVNILTSSGRQFRGQWHEPSGSTLFSDADGLILRALNISTGKSANPIIRLPRVPRSAEAPPDMGSHGPSSESYSRGRYLALVSLEVYTADAPKVLQFEVIEIQKIFVEQGCCCECTKPDGRSFDTPDSRSTW